MGVTFVVKFKNSVIAGSMANRSLLVRFVRVRNVLGILVFGSKREPIANFLFVLKSRI